MRFLILFFLPVLAFSSERYQQPDITTDTAVSASTAANSLSGTSNNYLSLIGNITQPQPHNCFVPAKGKGRSFDLLFIFRTSGLLALDSDCWDEYKVQNEHTRDMERLKLEILKLEAEADIERLRNEVIACRQREACELGKLNTIR